MSRVTISGKEYTYSIKAGAIRKFEEKTGANVMQAISSGNGNVSYTDFLNFIFDCVEGITWEILDNLDFTEPVDIFQEIMGLKKREASPEEKTELKQSADSHITTESLPANGESTKEEPGEIIPLSSNTSLSEQDREKILSDLSEGPSLGS